MVAIEQELLTADEFFLLSFHNRRGELIQGEVNWLSPAGGEHGFIAMRIGARLLVHVEAHGLGVVCAAETGFIIARNPDTVRAPDAAFISNERMGETRRPRKFWPFAPDIAVEVVSPGDTAEEIERKIRDWFNGDTRQVWVIYPASRTIHVYHSASDVMILSEADTLDGGDVVPGFSCPVAEVFA